MDNDKNMDDEMQDTPSLEEDDGDFSGESVEPAEEEWDSFDEGEYIDDSDGADDPAARGALFMKVVVGIGVVMVLGVGAYFIFSGGGEDLQSTATAQTGDAVHVSSEQKVEFHGETKVNATDTFGVTYGQKAPPIPEEEKEKKLGGLLNNPEDVKEIEQNVVTDVEYGMYSRPEVVTGQLPMPAPIGQDEERKRREGLDEGMDEAATGLIPLPGASGSLETAQVQNTQLPGGPGSDGLESASDSQNQALPGADTAKAEMTLGEDQNLESGLDKVLERLDSIENRLSQLEESRNSLDAIKGRLDKIEAEGQPRSAGKGASSPSSRLMSRSASVTVAKDVWVLKSAQPDTAMVSRQGETEMRSVAVGDTLRGIGRITAVALENGQWVVRGTTGEIRQ